jgi:deoxyribodipyrimidine photo-lyase
MTIPALRLRSVNAEPLRAGGTYVLYWMIAARRTGWNFALDHALARAAELGLPLIVLEGLRAGYPYASDRLHAFVMAGMADNQAAFADTGVLYHPYVEPVPGAGKGLLEALARGARLVVTDDSPTFFLPRMVAAAGARLDVRLEAVDSNGILPLRAAPQTYARAFDFRRFLQDELPAHLGHGPRVRPLAELDLPSRARLPRGLAERWPAASAALLGLDPAALASLPIDHSIPPAPLPGGQREGARRLARFVAHSLPRYAEERDDPEEGASSGLSPWLHFGHVSAHQVLGAVARREGWKLSQINRAGRKGARSGWWGMSPSAEAFLDQLVTWRELGFNFSHRERDPYSFDSLPDWARQTLLEHASDRRGHLYDLGQLERGETHDEVWNAAQNQLRVEGVIHNYLRMLWGKKVLEWSRDPREALRTLVELNDRYALDGRDPNSASGICWIFGRYDRAWGPERPVYGKIRYMTSASTRRKLRLEGYLERWEG